MIVRISRGRGRPGLFTRLLTSAWMTVVVGISASATSALADSNFFSPGNLVVSRGVYDNNPNNVQAGIAVQPPNCVVTSGSCSAVVTAVNDGTYPYVWNDGSVDPSFGITSKIFLDQITTDGSLINSRVSTRFSPKPIPTSFHSGYGSRTATRCTSRMKATVTTRFPL